ncbi:MAG: LysM peptidoglycan-binding domain-containing protein [Anaerolineae bacterium]|nr:LysM peptidoglycan-binding domain-containing protein [Anaerolineae bacterium]
MRHRQSYLIHFAVCLVLILALVSAALFTPQPVAALQGENLLQNGGFEGEYVAIGGDPSLRLAPSWQPWSLPPPPGAPSSVNLRPDYQPAPANRVHGGSAAQEYNTFFATHEGGVYQRVPITPGAELRFSVFIYVWSSATFEDPDQSIQPQDVEVQVGIDPSGGQDGASEAIIWSDATTFYDEYRELSVEATAQATAVTVFVRSNPQGAVGVNNIYVDDARLVQLGEGPTDPTPTVEGEQTDEPTDEPTEEPNEPTATATRQATATVPPDILDEFPERTNYTVQAGDTVLGIASRFSSSTEAIIIVNGLNESGFITVGQQLVIPVPSGQGTQATATVQPTSTTAAGATAAAPTPTSDGSGGAAAPATGNPPGTHIVQQGETLFRIALLYNTTVETLASMNNITNPNVIPAGTILKVPVIRVTPTATPTTGTGGPFLSHVVRAGENIFRIGLQYNVTVTRIAAVNGLNNPNLIYVGQVLLIPR